MMFRRTNLVRVVALGALMAAVGCETMKGVGRDITAASTTMQQTFFE